MKKLTKFISKNLESIVSLDLRALGVFRISLGAIFLIDMLDRLKDVYIFYVKGGVGINGNSNSLLTDISFSINNLNGDAWFQITILITAAFLSFLLLIGFKTKFITPILWIFVVSIQNRNFLILQGGDDLMRILLFWGIFLPIGLRFSYDYFRNKTNYVKQDNKFISPVNIGLIFQMIFLYHFSAVSKSDPIWNKEFTAIYYSLNLDIFVTWIGRILLNFRDLLRPLTAFTYYLEYYVGVLIILPVFNWVTRTFAVILLIGLHIGIGTTLDVGPFPWIAMTGVISLTPTEAIDLVINFLKRNNIFNKLVRKLQIQKIVYKISKYLPEKKKSTKNIIPKKYREWLFISTTLALSLITFVLTFVGYIWNINNNGGKILIPQQVRDTYIFFRMDQQWAMFAPYPFTDDGWYVILGHTESGNTESLFGEREKTTFDKWPENYSQNFKNERWRKFMTNLWYERYLNKRNDFVKFICKEWKEDSLKIDKLKSVEMYYMLERTLPEGEVSKIEKIKLAETNCT